MSGSVAWISYTPVKGLRMLALDETELTADGVPGDRAFFVVDERGHMVSITRLGALAAVVPEHDARAQTLALGFPGGDRVEAAIELGEPENVAFFQLALDARPVLGPFAQALSEHCGKPLRLFAAPPKRTGIDRGRVGAASLLSIASLERLRQESGDPEPVDQRRFRMTFGIDGLQAHEEDAWLQREVRVGEALLRVTGNVGRCAATTRQPETGVVDFKTLHYLKAYRDEVPTTEPLPFGVHASVLEPGRVKLGDPVGLA